MATSYGDLENRDGTIYNKKTGKGYATPAALATDMGINPHEINWGNIAEYTPPAAAPTAPTPTAQPTPRPQPTQPAPRPAQSAPAPTPSAPQANYSGLVDVNGEIQTADGKRKFTNPADLANYLGINETQVQWGQIKKPSAIQTSDQVRKEEEDASMPYVKYAGGDEVFDKEGQHITAEQAAQIPDFWSQVHTSGETRPEGLLTPIESIQAVFGADWQPSPAFTPELQAQGIYGAVSIEGMDGVWTIGKGGMLETNESYQTKFGKDISDTAGIVGDPITIEQAKKLGITIPSEQLLVDLDELDPEIEIEMTPEEKAKIAEGIYDEATAKHGVDDWREKRNEAYQKIIDTLATAWTDYTKAKEEEKERLDMEAKDKAIKDAQQNFTDLHTSYLKAIDLERYKGQSMEQILGRQAKFRSQMAIELAPLASAIQIAQGSWDRAKEMLDDFSNDWKQGMEWGIKATQAKIDMLGENLTEAQEKAKWEAQNKLNWVMEDYERKLETAEEVKKLMLMFPEAGVSIADSWEDAYHKIAPYIKDEKDFEDKMNAIDLQIKQKSLVGGSGGGRTYAPSAAKKLYNELGGQSGTGLSFNEWYNKEQGGDTYDLSSSTPPDAFKKALEEANQMSISSSVLQENWDEYKSTAEDLTTKGKPDKDKIGSYIQRRISEGAGWAVIAEELEAKGIPTYMGSWADKKLNEMFGERIY